MIVDEVYKYNSRSFYKVSDLRGIDNFKIQKFCQLTYFFYFQYSFVSADLDFCSVLPKL